MTKRRAFVLALALLLGLALAAAGATGTWLFYTESGLAWLSTRVAGYAGKGLTLEGVTGTLAGGATVQQIRYAGDDIEVRVRDARLRVAPLSVLRLAPRIIEPSAGEVAVVTKPGEPRGRPPDSLALPANFEVRDAYIGRLTIDLGKGPLDITDVRLTYAGGESEHHVRDLSLSVLGHAVSLRGTIAAKAPFPLNASIAAVRRESPQGDVYAVVTGNLSDLAIEGGGRSAGASLGLTASVHPYDPLPLVTVAAHVTGLDLEAFLPQLPRTAISVETTLTRTGDRLSGPLRATNALSGPYDKNRLPVAGLRASVRTDLSALEFTGLIVDLAAAGAVSGSGKVALDRAHLSLQTKTLNLAGLHSRLRKSALAGRAALMLSAARQSVTAELAQDDLSLQLTAHRTGEVVNIPEFRARARGGVATGEAHITLARRQPFAVEAKLSRFDPAAWGDFPAGAINGTLTARGTLADRSAEVRFAIRDSRWLEAPLAANGTVSIAEQRVHHADVDATLGGNRISAQGALGRLNDTLAVRFDAPRLGLLDKQLEGVLRGTAQVSGTLSALDVRFDLTGSDVAHRAIGRIKALDARGRVSLQPEGPMEVDAALRGVMARGWQLKAARLNLNGTRGAHAAVVQAQGNRIDFRARARGGWRPGTGWSGALEELVNRGEVPVELVSPVSLALSPQRVQVEPFELRVVGGRLAVSELRYTGGRLSTAGRFSDLPVRPLVALAGGPADRAGTLRLTGNWSVSNAPRLVGSIRIERESGDVALGADGSIRPGLQTLAISANIGGQASTFQAHLRSALANATAEGRVSAVGAGDAARYTGASPLAFTAQVDIARLAPFAALIDTAMLIEGEAHARLQGRGTLADPQVIGTLTAERLAVALPAEGINLQGGTLKAVLTEREVRVEAFSIRGGEGVLTAHGTLARNGYNEAALEWRAEGLRVLARPDRRLVVSGKGNAALRAGKLTFTGNLRANEGLFELADTDLPTLGKDVVIVGRQRPVEVVSETKDTKKGPRAAVDVSIDLGSNVHVRGRGLDVWLSGEVRVFTSPQGEIRATGVVSTRYGTFVAYGQRLEIDRGRIFFNGPIANPGLDIVAMRKRQAVEAGVAVTGTLRNPVARVVSDPPLPEGEALSWLLLGRAPSDAGSGQLSALPLATGALLGKASGPLAGRLGLDELSFRGGGVGEQFVTLGKRISDRLYVVFEQGLGAAENLLRLEFALTERIGLRAQTGETNSLGIFYRYRWD